MIVEQKKFSRAEICRLTEPLGVLKTAASLSLFGDMLPGPPSLYSCTTIPGRSLDKIKCAHPAISTACPHKVPCPLPCTSLGLYIPATHHNSSACANTLFLAPFFCTDSFSQLPYLIFVLLAFPNTRPLAACQVHVAARADPGFTRGMVAPVPRREYGSDSSRLDGALPTPRL